MWPAFAIFGSILLLGFKVGIWLYKKNLKKPTYEEDKQKMENAIARGNAADLSALFDDVRRPPDKDNISGSGSKEAP